MPDVEPPQLGLGGLAPEHPSLAYLFLPRLGLFEGQRVLFGLNRGQHRVLSYLELGARHVVGGLRHGRLVAGVRRRLFGLDATNLLLEILEVGAAVEGGANLILRVEFDQHVARLDARAALDEFRDDQCRRGLARQAGGGGGGRADGLGDPGDSDRALECAAGDRDRRCCAVGRRG